MAKKFLTDEEMQALSTQEQGSAEKPQAKKFLTNEEMEAISGGSESSWGDSVLEGVSTVGNFVDSYTGAPTRAAIEAWQDGRSALSAFGDQMGEDPSLAPTGKEIALKAGASDNPLFNVKGSEAIRALLKSNPIAGLAATGLSALKPEINDIDIKPSGADLAGVGVDVLGDWTNLLPAIPVAKKLVSGVTIAAKESPLARQAVKIAQEQAAGLSGKIGSKTKAAISGGGVEVEQSGKLFSVNTPKSLDELREWTPKPGTGELPGKARLREIEATLPDLETKPLKYHYDMMENPKAMKALKLEFENLPTNDAKKIAAYNQQMVEESGRKIQETVSAISPNSSRSLSEAGDDLIETVKSKYNDEKDALGPLFERLQKTSRKSSRAETMDLAQAIGENSKIGKLLETDEGGRLFLRKNTPRSGLSDTEHSVLSRVIDDLNDGMTFKEIQDTRSFLRKNIDPSNPSASEEISKVNSILLGQLEAMARANGPDVGETFKAYAINERTRESVEKIIGGRIESLDAMYSANPERVVKKIFANPNHAKIVADYVGPEKMQDLVGVFVNNGIQSAFDSANGFNPSKLRTWLRTNSTFMDNYAGPEVTQRLNALADYGYFGKRYLDEVNPSGTAAALLKGLKPETIGQKISTQGVTGTIVNETVGRVSGKLKQRQATKSLNEALGGGEKVKKPINLKPIVGSGAALRMLREPEFRAAEQEQELEGFKVAKTTDLPPDLIPEVEMSLKGGNLSPIEKAKRLNLLRKHGKAVLDE